MEPVLAAIFERTGGIPEGLSPRDAFRLALTDETGLSAEDWDKVAGDALTHAAEGTAKAHELLWLRARTGIDDDRVNALLATAVLADVTPAAAHRRIARLPQAAMRHALEWIGTDGDDAATLTLQLVEALGKRVQNFRARITTLRPGISAHDAIMWLPLAPDQPQVLSRFLTEVDIGGMQGDRALDALKAACASWEALAGRVAEALEADLTPTLADVSTWQKSTGAGMFADGLAATTWAQVRGVSWTHFPKALALIEESFDVPRAPLPTRTYETERGYTARFLDRSDPLGLILGDLTDCCQRLGGAGSSCVKHGFRDPSGGFFAVFDRSGRVVAQSWTWFNEDGFCFDNVEMLESDAAGSDAQEARRAEVRSLYETAAADLVEIFGRVNVGVAYTDQGLTSAWARAGEGNAVSTSGLKYTDAKAQRMLARKKTALGLSVEGGVISRNGTPLLEAVRDASGARPVTRVRVLSRRKDAAELAPLLAGSDDLELTLFDGTLSFTPGSAPGRAEVLSNSWAQYTQWLDSLDRSGWSMSTFMGREDSSLPEVYASGIDVPTLAAYLHPRPNRSWWGDPSKLRAALAAGLTTDAITRAVEASIEPATLFDVTAAGSSIDDLLWAKENGLELGMLLTGARAGLDARATTAFLDGLDAPDIEAPKKETAALVLRLRGYGHSTSEALDLIREFAEPFNEWQRKRPLEYRARLLLSTLDVGWSIDLLRARLANTSPRRLRTAGFGTDRVYIGRLNYQVAVAQLAEIFAWPVHPADVGDLMFAGLSLDQVRDLLLTRKIAVSTVNSALNADMGYADIASLHDAKVPVGPAASALRAGMTLAQVRATHAAGQSLQTASQEARSTLSAKALAKVRASGAKLTEVELAVKRGMKVDEAIALHTEGLLTPFARVLRVATSWAQYNTAFLALLRAGVPGHLVVPLAYAGLDRDAMRGGKDPDPTRVASLVALVPYLPEAPAKVSEWKQVVDRTHHYPALNMLSRGYTPEQSLAFSEAVTVAGADSKAAYEDLIARENEVAAVLDRDLPPFSWSHTDTSKRNEQISKNRSQARKHALGEALEALSRGLEVRSVRLARTGPARGKQAASRAAGQDTAASLDR